MASKLYTENNSIILFAERCNLEVNYIAAIISGQRLINAKDVKNIADHLSVDPEGLINVIPKTDEELMPFRIIEKENNNMVDNFDLNNDFNKRIRTIIERKGYGFKEFCKAMDINSNTFTSALHRGRLPLKNQELVIKTLGLDMIPETPKVKVSMNKIEEVCKNPEPEVTDNNKIDEKDLIEVLENFSVMDDNLQISFIRLIDISRKVMSNYEHIEDANVLGRMARMNYINDLAK
jgi:transcriptional regulator with XRE-family HTH domain